MVLFCRSQNAVPGPWQPPSRSGPPLLLLGQKKLEADADLGGAHCLGVCECARGSPGSSNPATGVREQVRRGEGGVHVRLELRRGWRAASWHLY